MRLLTLTAVVLFAPLAPAAETFPGLKAVLTPEEWRRAGLDRLSPDELGVVDAALIRHQRRLPAPAAPTAPATGMARPAPAAPAAPTAAQDSRTSWRERFGLGQAVPAADDWRNQPALVAKVLGWHGSNGFLLDNGQVWEGQETIPFELPGRTVSIEARPLGAFALRVGEQSMTVRVRRVR